MIRTINAVVRIDKRMPFTIEEVKQGDEITLVLRVTNDGEYLDLSNQTIVLRSEICGKVHLQSNNISISSHSVTILCDNEHFQTVGLSRFELELTDSNGTTRSGDFCILINKMIEGESPDYDDTTIHPTAITLNQTELNLSLGDTQQLTYTILPTNTSNKSVTWLSSNSSIITVSNGTVIVKGVGEATVIVSTIDGGLVASCKVNVQSVSTTGIVLDTAEVVLSSGEYFKINATVYPSNATNKTVVWESSDNNVATVSGNGLVKAISKGNAIITAITVNGEYFERCYVNVEEISTSIPVSSINISQSSLNLNVGNTTQLYATVYPTNATNQQLKWSAIPSVIAEVDENGVVRALSNGTATITVSSSNGKTSSCTVNVKTLTIGGIISSVKSLSVGYGETTSFTVCLSEQPTDTQSMTISSDDCNVNPSTLSFTLANWNVPQTITITPTRLGDGSVIIETGNITKEIPITIAKSYATILLMKTDVSVRAGDTSTFTVSLSSQPSSDQYVSISINNSNAIISNSSLTFTSANWNIFQMITVIGVAEGSSTITVSLNNSTKYVYVTILQPSTDTDGDGGLTSGGTSSNLVSIEYPASKKANPSEWNALGDSITYGYNVGGNSNAYPARVNYSVSMTTNNYGITGTCISTGFNDLCSTEISQSFVNRYNQMSSTADLITVFGGINDFLCSVPIGCSSDRTNTTFYGALNNLISSLKSRYNGKRIVFFTPIRIGGYTNTNGVNATLKDYRNAIVTICNNNQLEVLDLYSLESLDTLVSIENYMGEWDSTHPNGTGQQIIANYIISQMLNGSESEGGAVTETPQLNPSYITVAVGGTATVNIVNTSQIISSVYSRNDYVNINYTSSSINIMGSYVGMDNITVLLSGGTTLSLPVDIYSECQTDNPYFSDTNLSFHVGSTTTIYLRGTTQTITNAYTSSNCVTANYTKDSILLTGNSIGTCVLSVILSSGSTLKTNITVQETTSSETGGVFDNNNPTVYSSTEKILTLTDSSKVIEYCYLAVGNATIVSKTENWITVKATADGIDYLNYVFSDGTNGCITLNCVNDRSSVDGAESDSTEGSAIFNNDNPTIGINDSITLTLKDSSQTLKTVYVAKGNGTISSSNSTSVTITGVSMGTEYLNYIIIKNDGSETSGSITVTVVSEDSGGSPGDGSSSTTTNTFNTIYPSVAVGATLTITLKNKNPSISDIYFNSSIAKITNQMNTQITFKGVEKGTATVIVTLSDNSIVNLTLNVTESTTIDDSPYLYPASTTITLGSTITFNVYRTTQSISKAYVVSGSTSVSSFNSYEVNVLALKEGTDYLNVTLSNNKQLLATISVVSSGASLNGISNASETALTQQYSISHEVTPNIGNPPSGSYNWKYAPRINPDGSFPISSWNAFGHWMTTYKIEGGSYYNNVGLLLQDPVAWIWNSSTKSWDVLSNDFEWGNWYVEDFWDDGSGYIAGTTEWETGVNGNHSTWVKIKQTSETSGRCFHPWGYQKNWRSNSSWANNGCPYIVTKIDFKLVKWDESDSDNLDSAQLVVNSGGDWWRNVGDVWKSDWSTNRDMCVGKYIKATRELKRAWATNLPNNWGYGLPTDSSSSSSKRR